MFDRELLDATAKTKLIRQKQRGKGEGAKGKG